MDSTMVGMQSATLTHVVDARWLMAYGAGLGDLNPRCMDTAAQRVTAHPLFPVCLEWPVILATRELRGHESTTAAERARGVHAAHDLHLYRPIRAGERLSTQATVIGLAAIKPGAAQTLRLDTRDEQGELICRTYHLGISRGVEVTGEPLSLEQAPAIPQPGSSATLLGTRQDISVAAGAAHVYTECARIWNPIHTDRAVALAAGLPDIILHGTATLALALTRLVDTYLAGDPTRVTRVGGRFTAMVLMPSTLTLEVHSHDESTLFFTVYTQNGEAAFSQGFLCFGAARN